LTKGRREEEKDSVKKGREQGKTRKDRKIRRNRKKGVR
jgi:hypothetical protein